MNNLSAFLFKFTFIFVFHFGSELVLASDFKSGREPKVGASVTIQASQTYQGRLVRTKIKKTIKEIKKSSDGKTDLYRVEWKPDSEEEAVQVWVDLSGLGYISDITEFCLQNRGSVSSTFEKLQTKDGEILTCRVDNHVGGTIWYTEDFPFGVIREYLVFQNGDYRNMFLLKSNW